MDRIEMEQVRSELMRTNEQFRQLAEQHSSYDRRLEELASRRFPSEEEQIEEARLKRIKLKLKEQMEQMVEHSESATVH